MTSEGWFVVSRNLTDARHELHPQATGEPACRLGAWIDLLGYARWKDKGGICRGDMVAGERFLASRWNWSRAKVRRFLAELERDGRIERITVAGPRKPDHIRICNYESYQDTRPTNEATNETTNDTKEEQEQEQILHRPKNRAHALPDTWRPNEGHGKLAAELRLDLPTEVLEFRDHAKANGRTQKDWDASFRNWMRNTIKFQKKNGKHTRNPNGQPEWKLRRPV